MSSGGRRRAVARRPLPPVHGADGAVTQDPTALLDGVRAAIREAVERSGVASGAVGALSVSAQRATFACLGRDGRALGPLRSWMDVRGGPMLASLVADPALAGFPLRTGLPPAPVFSLARLLWLRAREAGTFAATRRVSLVADLVLASLGAERHVTDAANASLTGLYLPGEGVWWRDVLDRAGIDPGWLPEVVPPGTPVGRMDAAAAHACGLAPGTLLVAGGGDHQCAGLGAGAIVPGIVEITMGTTAASLTASPRFAPDPRGALFCCAHAAPGRFALEGLQTAVGGALAWLRGLVGPAVGARRLDALLLRSPPGARGVRFFPFLVGGSSAPRWNPAASGTFVGLEARHGVEDVARAVVEGVAHETALVLDAFRARGVPVRELRLTGGLSRRPGLRRVLADVTACPVATLASDEASVHGAAILALLGLGAWPDVDAAVAATVRAGEPCQPDPDRVTLHAEAHRGFVAALDALESGVYPVLRSQPAEHA